MQLELRVDTAFRSERTDKPYDILQGCKTRRRSSIDAFFAIGGIIGGYQRLCTASLR